MSGVVAVRVPHHVHACPSTTCSMTKSALAGAVPFDAPETGSHPKGFINVAPPSRSGSDGAASRKAFAEQRRALATDENLKAAQQELLQEADNLTRHLVHRPIHGSAVHGLVMKHRALGGAIRLAVKWLSAHMFLPHIQHELVELLVSVRVWLYLGSVAVCGALVCVVVRLPVLCLALCVCVANVWRQALTCGGVYALLLAQAVFLDTRPYDVPHTPVAGFLRWLEFMGTFDWERQPLLVDVNKEQAPHDSASLLTKFKFLRKTRGSEFAPMFVVTPRDRPMWMPVWGVDNPGTIVLARLQAFARSSLRALEASLAPGPTAFASRFVVVTGVVDAWLWLRLRLWLWLWLWLCCGCVAVWLCGYAVAVWSAPVLTWGLALLCGCTAGLCGRRHSPHPSWTTTCW